LFGTSGIRGIYGKDIDEGMASRIAAVFSEEVLYAGRDTRSSGLSLLEALVEGAGGAGADVVDLGIVPTPTVALAAKAGRGIMITASHNPAEYNGLKLIEDGKEICKALEKRISADYEAGRHRSGGNGRVLRDRGILEDHKGMARGLVDAEAIGRRRPKVIVDCNGAASSITPYLLSDLGCQVISLNCQMEGFHRPSEPNGASMPYMEGLIKGSGADFAISHDGDGDRCMIFDETGAMLPLDAQLAIMISHEMEGRRGKRIVSTVEASLTVREAVEDAGGSIDITPVGSTYVADRMEEAGALFGGEPCGEYIYKDGVHVPDAVLAAAKFAQIFSERGSFSQLKTRYPQHFMAREKVRASDKRRAMELIEDDVRALGIEGPVRDDDGIRVDEEDGWFLVRASGTEPILRLTLEYKDEAKLKERKGLLLDLIGSRVSPADR